MGFQVFLPSHDPQGENEKTKEVMFLIGFWNASPSHRLSARGQAGFRRSPFLRAVLLRGRASGNALIFAEPRCSTMCKTLGETTAVGKGTVWGWEGCPRGPAAWCARWGQVGQFPEKDHGEWWPPRHPVSMQSGGGPFVSWSFCFTASSFPPW